MSAREEILQRIRTATADVAEKDPILDVPVEWTYGQALQTPDVLADFVEKVEDYKARVVRVAEGDIGSAIVEALAGLQAGSAVLPGGLPEAWVQAVTDAGVEVFRDDPELSHGELNLISAVVTTAAVGWPIRAPSRSTMARDRGDAPCRCCPTATCAWCGQTRL